MSVARLAGLWALTLIAIAIAIAAGTRIVAWLTLGDADGVWQAAVGLLIAAGAGGTAIASIMNGRRH